MDIQEHDGYDGYFGALIFFVVLQWLAALGRCAIRLGIVKNFGPDDWAMVVTLLLSSAYCGGELAILILTGGGRRNAEVDPFKLLPTLNVTLATICLYIWAAAALKVALGLLLLRVLVRPWQVFTIYGAIALNLLYGTAYFFFALFECGNPSRFNTRIILGQCLSRTSINGTSYTHSVINALTDLLFGVLPVFLIWHSSMSRRAKFSVGGILGLGSVGIVATLVRIGYIKDLSAPTDSYFITAKPIALLSSAELSIGITCIALCTYKPLFHRYFSRGTRYYYPAESDGERTHQSQNYMANITHQSHEPDLEQRYSRRYSRHSQFSPRNGHSAQRTIGSGQSSQTWRGHASPEHNTGGMLRVASNDAKWPIREDVPHFESTDASPISMEGKVSPDIKSVL